MGKKKHLQTNRQLDRRVIELMKADSQLKRRKLIHRWFFWACVAVVCLTVGHELTVKAFELILASLIDMVIQEL